MSISKGNTGIGKAYVGPKEVKKAFVGDKLVYQSAIPFDPVFANNDWATIRAVVRSGNIPSAWAIGDTKNVTLTNGQTIAYRICDKQAGRYALADGSGSSNMVLEPLTLIKTQDYMNSSVTNAGGFASCFLCTYRIPNVYLPMFPADVRNAMSTVKVLSGTGRSTSAGTSSSNNKIFLAAEMEIFATKTRSIGIAECPLGRFDYYKTHTAASERIKQRSGSNDNYWLRSPVSGDSRQFTLLLYEGSAGTGDANEEQGIALFFAI